MFCSNCGKTLKAEATTCPSCGAPVGESRMDGSTSVQTIYAPGESPREKSKYSPYTRLSYSTADVDDADVYSRTNYRPAFDDSVEKQSAPEEQDAQEQASAPEEQSAPVPEDDDIALPDDIFQGISPEEMKETPDGDDMPSEAVLEPLQPVAPKGISPEVQEYMRQMSEARAKSRKRRAARDEDEPDEEEIDGESEESAEIDEAEDGEKPVPRRSEKKKKAAQAKKQHATATTRTWILRGAAALTLVILVIAGVLIMDGIANSSPIAGVTKDFRAQGIALLEEHTTDAYRKEILTLYNADATGVSAMERQASDRDAYNALLPASPLENDQMFLDTLLAVQDSIDNATMMDSLVQATASENTNAAMVEQSKQMWSVITNAIQKLKQCSNAAELPTIMANAETEMATPAPEATDTPEGSKYITLSKGMKNSTEVKALQQRLYELGFFNGKRDGAYGAVTKRAVQTFQQAAGLATDGIATPELQELMYSDEAPRSGIKATDAPADGGAEATPTPAPAA